MDESNPTPMDDGDGRIIKSVVKNAHSGLRTFLRSPGYTLMVVLTLRLGIGANTAMFSVINGVLLQPLPYRNGHELVLARQQALGLGTENIPFSVKEIINYRE